MPRTKPAPPRFRNLGELLESLGGISADRVCIDPPPGRATKQDLLRVCARADRLYELVEGTLVEKPIGHPESYLALELGFLIRTFLEANDLGYCTGADDLIELSPNLVRGPDFAFTSWTKRPQKTVDGDAITRVIPDLAVEILSPSNTRGEIERKLKEYFLAGVQMVWVIDHRKQSADVYTAPDRKTTLDEAGTLDGGAVLPGLQIPLAKLFERVEKPKTKKRKI
jgi:Uma2 family endonuclease